MRAQHAGTSGAGRALWASTDSTFGYAGFFEGGRSFFEGNIGVGNQMQPNYPIDVRGANAALRVEATGGSAAFLRMERADEGASYIALGNDNSMFFNINASDRMVLTADGLLGLGTQTPSAAWISSEVEASMSAHGCSTTQAALASKRCLAESMASASVR